MDDQTNSQIIQKFSINDQINYNKSIKMIAKLLKAGYDQYVVPQ